MKNIKYKKTGTVHRIRHFLDGPHPHGNEFYDSLCGVFACGKGAMPTTTLPSLNTPASKTYILDYELTNGRVTCRTCLKMLKQRANSEARKNLKPKKVSMLQTSDGKLFIFDKEDEALKHEKFLRLKKSRLDFVKFVKTELFKSPTDEEEEDIVDDMCDKLNWLFSDIAVHLDDFSDILWQLFINYEEITEKAFRKFKEIKE